MANKLNQQLNNLRNEIKPDQAWQARSRDILLMQIRQGAPVKEAHWFTFLEAEFMQRFFFQATRPLSMAMVILLAIFSGSMMSIRAAHQTKPGDALYIAKIISEKAHFAVTFDNTQKAKLNLTFAANRAAELKEIVDVKTNNADQEQNVKDLTSEIKAEIDEAQTRIAKITPVTVKILTSAKTAPTEKEVAVAVKAMPSTGANKVAPAVVEKDKTGIEYYDPRQAALEQAKNYIEQKDYNAAATQLNTLNDAIDQPEKLEVKKASSSDVKAEKLEKEKATSTN